MRLVHIFAGSLGLASGAVALLALKGAKLHRKSGTIFVYAMLVMSASGAVMAARQPTMVVVMAGVLTFYLVLTALLTVRRPVLESHWTDAVGMLVALTVGVAGIAFGFEALGDISGKKDGHPAATYFIFGAVALLAALGDARMMLAHRIQGAQRIARHLWRMCFALGSGTMVAEAASQRLLAIPALMVLSTMFYWLARVWVMQRPVADPRSTAASPDPLRYGALPG